MRRWWSWAVVPAAGALTLVAPAPVGAAQEDGSGEEPSMVVLLDRQVDGQEALSSVIGGLPLGAPLGVAAYGGGGDPCGPGEVVLPVGPLDPGAASQALGGLAPAPPAVASAPVALGAALEQAVDAFPPGGSGTVVVVAGRPRGCDGEDPCALARDLAASDPALRVEVVGVGVDLVAAEQLTCMAEATGGDFRGVSDAAALAQAVRFVAVGVVGATQTQGLRAQGGDDPDTAPTLQADQYLDRLERDGLRSYAVELAPGEQLRASATLVRAPGEVASGPRTLRARVLDPAHREVASDEEVGEGPRLGSVSVASGVVAPDAGGRWFVTLDLDADEGLEVELLLDVLDEELAVATTTVPPAAPITAAARPPAPDPFLASGAGLAVLGAGGAGLGFLVGVRAGARRCRGPDE